MGVNSTLHPKVSTIYELRYFQEKLFGVSNDMARDEIRKVRGGYYNQEWIYYICASNMTSTW
jgi:hypothetical protein